MAGNIPSYSASQSRGGCVISGHEIIWSPLGSESFSTTKVAMIPNTFSWLRGVSKNWSRYHWLNLRAEFITAVGTNTPGSISMGATYNVLTQDPQDQNEMSALAHSFVGPIWGNAGTSLHTVQFDSTRWSKPWWTYTANPQVDYNEFVPAWLWFATSGTTGDAVGHIVVHYTIELLDPIPARMNEASLLDFIKTTRKEESKKPSHESLLITLYEEVRNLKIAAANLEHEEGSVVSEHEEEENLQGLIAQQADSQTTTTQSL